MIEPWYYLFITMIGIFTGCLNILAGGGTFISLPILIFLGIPATLASSTTRVAVVAQSFNGARLFHKKKVLPVRFAILLAIPALIGSFLGAHLLFQVSDEAIEKILAAFMIGILILMNIPLFKHRHFLKADNLNTKKKMILFILFFFIGLYGGFLQAGNGFLIIAALAVYGGLDLVQTNSIKVFVVFLYNLVSVIYFISQDKIIWPIAIALALGNGIGAWIGVHYAVKKGHDWIKKFVTVVILIFAIKLLFF